MRVLGHSSAAFLTRADRDNLVVDYAIAAWERASCIPDALFVRLRDHFSEAQIVVPILRITLRGSTNSTTRSRIEKEPSIPAWAPAPG